MNYELVKKLKDAGFPQKSVQPEDCLVGDFDCEDCGCDFAYNPTLSELIEACKTEAFLLGCAGGKWVAWGGGSIPSTNGDTPEEAVAELWLKLNTK